MTRAAARERRGVALAAAIGGLVVIGVLIAGVFFSASQEFRVGTNTLTQEQAFRAAEFGINTTVANWDGPTMGALTTGATTTVVYANDAERWWDTVFVTKVNATTYQLVSRATARGPLGGEATRRTALTLRTSVLRIQSQAAVMARRRTRVGGSAVISGVDENPVSWLDCPPAAGTVAALSIDRRSDFDGVGCDAPAFRCLVGSPQLEQSPAAGDTTNYFRYGDEDWASLTRAANITFDGSQTMQPGPALSADGTCNRAIKTNWGMPDRTTSHACRNYFPIIWARGNDAKISLSGGTGQGILLVEGNLELSGGFSFYGPVIVRGRISTSGAAGGSVYGATLAANVNNNPASDPNEILGNAQFRYSQCTVNTAARQTLAPRRVTQRAWTELF